MIPAPFVNLPMDSRGCLVVLLDAVHAEVVPFSARMFGINEGQRHERAAVAVPGSQHRQGTELRRGLQLVKNGSFGRVFQADLQAFQEKSTVFPQFAGRKRHSRLD